MSTQIPDSIEAVLELLQAQRYLADRALATTVYLALQMQRPLFLEGEPGVGKTELARALATGLDRPVLRLQCYEGLDVAGAVYEWNYARQMIEIRLAEASGQTGKTDRDALAAGVFSEQFLVARPLLKALQGEPGRAPVLLIDELDRADEPFEAYLLELLSDFQISIPELGTIKAVEPPTVVITSNRTREIHDALKRRCLYYWVDYPDAERELAIINERLPELGAQLAGQVVAFVQRLRQEDLFKAPGIAESLDWAAALSHLQAAELEPGLVDTTLGALLKYQDDIELIRGASGARLLEQVKADLAQL